MPIVGGIAEAVTTAAVWQPEETQMSDLNTKLDYRMQSIYIYLKMGVPKHRADNVSLFGAVFVVCHLCVLCFVQPVVGYVCCVRAVSKQICVCRDSNGCRHLLLRDLLLHACGTFTFV